MNLKVRKMTIEDETKLLEWRNEKDAKYNSFSTKKINKDEHKRWFHNKLEDVDSEIFIGVNDDGSSVGMVRFDIDKNQDYASVSINVNTRWRGRKVSSILLDTAIQAFSLNRVLVLSASIRPENISSQKCFERSGFSLYESGRESLLYLNKVLIINEIERIRSKNNVNWMNLMRLAFRVAPKEAEEIFKKVNTDDGTIATLLKKLTKSIN